MRSLRLTLLVAGLLLAARAASPQIVDIPDLNLRAVIEVELSKVAGALITADEMATLTQLEAPNADIRDLTGIEFATNLRELNLGEENVSGTDVNSNAVSDLSPLAGLTNLIALDLNNNSISDLSPLAGLTHLTTSLDLNDNLISDLSPLAGLVNLIHLQLGNNLISDLSPLADLTKLDRLWLYGNLISDLSPLAGLVTLTTLHLQVNSVSNLSPLTGLIRLVELDLYCNPVSDISPLAELTNLRGLILSDNSVSDISPLAGLTNLTRWLYLDGNSISDLSPIAGLTNLKKLSLRSNLISDISSLAGLTRLTYLRLDQNPISGLLPLAGLIRLELLGLDETLISDISPLAGLANLTHLALEANSISDISPLIGLLKLTRLDLQNNLISDISPLVGLLKLTFLGIEQNTISDLSALVANTGLGSGDTIRVFENPLSDISINTHIPALLSRGVTVDGETVAPVKTDQARLLFPATAPVPIGNAFTLNLIVEDITDLAGWQLDIGFNPVVLKAVSVNEGNFLSKDGGSTFFQKGNINNTTGEITGLIAARISVGGISGTGTLLSINFEAKAAGKGNLTLHEVRLGDPNGDVISHELVINPITVESSWDVNGDGQINVFDLIVVAQNFGQANSKADVNNDGTVNIFDLIVVAQHLGESTTDLAPGGFILSPSGFNPTTIQNWIDMAQTADDGSLAFQQGITNLKHLLAAMIPDKTALLANYPNPFNPETWMPYRLARNANVTLTIYDIKGVVVRQFSLGYQQAGYYTDRTTAVYWDGHNNSGEPVGSGVYFYQLQVGNYSATRKMVILK